MLLFVSIFRNINLSSDTIVEVETTKINSCDNSNWFNHNIIVWCLLCLLFPWLCLSSDSKSIFTSFMAWNVHFCQFHIDLATCIYHISMAWTEPSHASIRSTVSFVFRQFLFRIVICCGNLRTHWESNFLNVNAFKCCLI